MIKNLNITALERVKLHLFCAIKNYNIKWHFKGICREIKIIFQF